MGAPRAICFSGLARPQSSLQTDDSRCDVGHLTAALDDRHLYDLPGNDRSCSNAEPALSTLSLCGPLTLDLFFQRSREQQLQPGRQCPRDYESLFSARPDPGSDGGGKTFRLSHRLRYSGGIDCLLWYPSDMEHSPAARGGSASHYPGFGGWSVAVGFECQVSGRRHDGPRNAPALDVRLANHLSVDNGAGALEMGL